MNKEEVKSMLLQHDFVIVDEKPTGNGLGTVIKLDNGCLVNCWKSGKINCQGKNSEEVEKLIKQKISTKIPQNNNKVFVVYGHDTQARTQLEAMLRRWDLQPLILDQIVSSGNTIIEKLEEYTSQVCFGIVLATPDDIGYSRDNESCKRYRVRQNVVLELGMLLSKIGRERVAILLSQAEDMEAPSDIQGLLYIPFKENVEDARLSLAKEMNSNGYKIDIEKL